MSTAPRGVTAARSDGVSRAAASRLQAKLSVGRSQDVHEQEADRVAGAVVGHGVAPTAAAAGPVTAGAAGAAPKISRLKENNVRPKLQRQEEEEPQAKLQRQEEEEPQAKLQRQEEEEPQAKLQRQEEEEPQAKLQRQEEEEEAQTKVQTRAEARPNVRDKRLHPELDRVESKLFESKGKGEPLPEETRIAMETGFGADFGAVRVHSGDDAVAMSRELRAQAFTHGKDIFFNSGKFEPDTVRGRTLLAHELTHVVQQGAAEQKVPEAKVAENNAKRGQAPPEPTDKQALKVEDATRGQIERNEPKPGEGPGSAAGTAAAPAAAETVALPPGSEETAEPAGPEGEAEGAAVETAAEKAGKAKAEKAAGKKPAKGRGKAKGDGVGAFLRQSTNAVFVAKKAGVAKLAANEKTKEAAETKVGQAQKAVVPPAEEGASQAKASQVERVEQAPEPAPDEDKAKQEFETALENAVPATLEEVDEFKEEGKGRVVGQAVKGVVTADAQEVKATYQEIDNPPAPEPPAQAPEELPPLETAPETAPIGMGDGVVGEVQPAHTDLSEFDKQSDDVLEKEQITDEQLEMVDEGDLAEAKQDRKSVKSKTKEGPREVKEFEAQEKQKVNKELQKEEDEARQKMREERQKELTGARDDQTKTKSKIEQKRQEVTDKINGIYQAANETVKQKLDDLEKTSLKAFDDGEKQATQAFEDNVKRRIDAFKRRRYDRFGGSLLWAKDKLFGMDDLPEVKGIFDSEKSRFVTAVDALVKKITAENKRVIQECKEIVATARKEIETFVEGLGPELKKTGEEALKETKSKLDALDKKVNDKEKELQQKLAAKREAAIKAIEEKIEKMKEEMSGLVAKLGNLLLNAMVKFFKWALKKAGYASDQLMEIVNKGKAVIKKIVTDPIGFIGNIIKAVKDGIGLFVTNIKKHLISGLITWLTGAMADVPITLPTKWDLKGILHLVLQILGLTWDRIRKKLVKRLGEKVVTIAETTVDILRRLITEGPIALWEMIKAKAAQIKQQVMEGIRNWLITQVVKQAIIKLLSFLNPAGAIIQAILAIYNTIMFFVENWNRIVQFVKTVFGSIADIAMGKLSAASQAVERALAMTIPIILNFLARLLGLSGIGKAVSDVIKKIRKPIDKVVDKVVDAVAKLAKKLLGKVKAGAKALKEKGLAVIQWWKQRKRFRTKGGTTHTLKFAGKGPGARLTVASNGTSIESYLANLKVDPSDPRHAAWKKADTIVKEIQVITRKKVEPKQAKLITSKLSLLSKLLIDLDPGGTAGLPEPKWGPNPARSSHVRGLSKGKTGGGSSPSGSSGEWKFLQGRGLTARTSTDRWVRMHLISEDIGGKGTPGNWTPAPNSVNTGPQVLHSFEVSLKALLKEKQAENQHNVVWADVVIEKTHSPKPRYDNLSGFPEEVSFKAGLEFSRKGKWEKDQKARLHEDVDIDEPPRGNLPSLSRASHTALSKLHDVFTPTTVRKIKADVDLKGPYGTRDSFINRMRAVEPKNTRWQNKIPELDAAVRTLHDEGKIKIRK